MTFSGPSCERQSMAAAIAPRMGSNRITRSISETRTCCTASVYRRVQESVQDDFLVLPKQVVQRQPPGRSGSSVQMRVTVVDVGVMGMLMSQHFVPMGMHMWLVASPRERMLMLVVLVVAVRVRVLQRLVCVQVFVPLSKVQPYADAHENRCRPEKRVGQLGP